MPLAMEHNGIGVDGSNRDGKQAEGGTHVIARLTPSTSVSGDSGSPDCEAARPGRGDRQRGRSQSTSKAARPSKGGGGVASKGRVCTMHVQLSGSAAGPSHKERKREDGDGRPPRRRRFELALSVGKGRRPRSAPSLLACIKATQNGRGCHQLVESSEAQDGGHHGAHDRGR